MDKWLHPSEYYGMDYLYTWVIQSIPLPDAYQLARL